MKTKRVATRFVYEDRWGGHVSHRISGATKTTIDDALIEHKLPKNVSRFVPYFFLHAGHYHGRFWHQSSWDAKRKPKKPR